MSASIHINGTASSVIDTIFVCRSTGRVPRHTIVSTAKEIAELVREDLDQLRAGGLKPTRGDARCIAHGHLIRLAIWNFRSTWVKDSLTQEKIRFVADAVQSLGGALGVEKYLPNDLSRLAGKKGMMVREAEVPYGPNADEIPF